MVQLGLLVSLDLEVQQENQEILECLETPECPVHQDL